MEYEHQARSAAQNIQQPNQEIIAVFGLKQLDELGLSRLLRLRVTQYLSDSLLRFGLVKLLQRMMMDGLTRATAEMGANDNRTDAEVRIRRVIPMHSAIPVGLRLNRNDE